MSQTKRYLEDHPYMEPCWWEHWCPHCGHTHVCCGLPCEDCIETDEEVEREPVGEAGGA